MPLRPRRRRKDLTSLIKATRRRHRRRRYGNGPFRSLRPRRRTKMGRLADLVSTRS